MKKKFMAGILCSLLFTCTSIKQLQAEDVILSPDGNIEVAVNIDNAGIPGYEIHSGGILVFEFSKLGLTGFVNNMHLSGVSSPKVVNDNYLLVSGKKKECQYVANERCFTFTNESGNSFKVIFQVSDHGVAFRYSLDKVSKSDLVDLRLKENSTFNFPDSTKAWLHPRTKPLSGWEQTQPSYEENYLQNIGFSQTSPFGFGWTFPCLFKSSVNWILISESNIGEFNCGSHLENNYPDSDYKIGYPDSVENLLKFTACDDSIISWSSPWRVFIISDKLGDIVESTMITDVANSEKIKDHSFVKPGIASWSWALLKDEATNYTVQKEMIDYAATMKWNYCLIDALWDNQIGRDKIKELADYAREKGIGLWLWYNSAGNWNTTKLTPRDLLATKGIREKEFSWLKSFGVKGIKVDFFGGDGIPMMQYYQEILTDAATFGLMVNFHGATVPRGWNRTYPNLMTMEAVKGFEYLTFDQKNADVEANHCCMLPFTRNVVGSMDFTPLCFSEIPGIERKTSNAFELALSVIFESGIQHFVELPEVMNAEPDYVIDFLKSVPVAWDDIRFIDGYPGEYVIIARRSGDKWYVAGINGTNQPKKLKIDLSFIDSASFPLNMITDGENNRNFSISKGNIPVEGKIEISMKPSGGFMLF